MSDNEDRIWRGRKFGDTPAKRDPLAKDWESDPAELEKQLRQAFASTYRPDGFEGIVDEIERQSLMTPEQKAAMKRKDELQRYGYVEVAGEVVKKEKAVELVQSGELDVADVFALRPVDVVEADEDTTGYASDDEDEWQLDDDTWA